MWEMRGIDVELDTNIGKRLSALGQTLTSLTGEEDESYLLEQSLERLDVSLEDMTDFPLVGSILALSTNIVNMWISSYLGNVHCNDMTDYPIVASILTLSPNIGHTVSVGKIFSSPEHKVLRVSYCDRPLSVVRRRAPCVNFFT